MDSAFKLGCKLTDLTPSFKVSLPSHLPLSLSLCSCSVVSHGTYTSKHAFYFLINTDQVPENTEKSTRDGVDGTEMKMFLPHPFFLASGSQCCHSFYPPAGPLHNFHSDSARRASVPFGPTSLTALQQHLQEHNRTADCTNIIPVKPSLPRVL